MRESGQPISLEIEKLGLDVPLMTPERYSQIEHKRPYIYELQIGESKLTYVGFGHSYDPSNPAYIQLINKFNEAHPDLVLVEGIDRIEERKEAIASWLQGKTNEEIIRRHGESIFTLSLAVKNGIAFDSPEPRYSDELRYLEEKGFSKEKIFVFNISRDIHQYNKIKNRPSLEEYLKHYLESFKEATNWEGFSYTLENYKVLYAKLFSKNLDLEDTESFRDLMDPIPWEGKEIKFTNQIASESNRYRDLYIINQIKDKLKKYKNIFIVYGASHAVMQEPALQYLAEHS